MGNADLPDRWKNVKNPRPFLERGERWVKAHRQMLALLEEVTVAYDQHAQSLLKAGQALSALQNFVPNGAQESLVFWSGETSRLSSIWKTEVAQELLGFINNSYDNTLKGMLDKLDAASAKETTVRQRAEQARDAMCKSVEEAETELQKLDDIDGPIPAWLEPKLQSVRRSNHRLTHLVDWHKTCKEQEKLLQRMTIETLYRMEEYRLEFFSNAVTKAEKARVDALREVIVSVQKQRSVRTIQRKTSQGHHNAITGSIQYEAKTGIMQAEALGLPEDVGELRDRARSQMANRSYQIQCLCATASALQQICTSLEQLSTALKAISAKQPYSPMHKVVAEMKHVEIAPIYETWSAICNSIASEASTCGSFATTLAKIVGDRFQTVRVYGDKLLSAAADSENLAWTHLCEASKAQAVAEQRYLQSTADKNRARERITSVDGSSSEPRSPARVNKHVSRSLANVFSVLPNGGEHAMKLLTAGTAASIAQQTLEDADEREAKERECLDNAIEETSRVVDKYKQNAMGWMKQFEEEDNEGWGDVSAPFSSLADLIENSRSAVVQEFKTIPSISQGKRHELVTSFFEKFHAESGVSVENVSPPADRDLLSCAMTKTLENALARCQQIQLSTSIDEISAETVQVDKDGGAEGCAPTNISKEAKLFGSDVNLFKADGLFKGDVNFFGSQNGIRETTDSSHNASREVSTSGHEAGSVTSQQQSWLSTLPNGMSDSFRETFAPSTSRRKLGPRYRRANVSAPTDVFATYFWPGNVDPEAIPPIVASFSCTSLSTSHRQSVPRYGHLFLSDVRVVFVDWIGKKQSIKLGDAGTSVDRSDKSLEVAYLKGTDKEVLLSLCEFSDLDSVLRVLQDKRETAVEKNARDDENGEKVASLRGGSSEEFEAPVSPETTLPRMDTVVETQIKNLSIKRFYEIVWAEGQRTEEAPLYEPFLKSDCLDVSVGQWEFMICKCKWDQESYSQKRQVGFRVRRTTHLYIGPPIATVKQVRTPKHCNAVLKSA